MATFYRMQGWVKSVMGQAISGAQIFICAPQPTDSTFIPPEPLASIFADPAGVTPVTQPLITDGFGFYDAYVASGIPYTIVVCYNASVQAVYPDQVALGATIGNPSLVTSVFGRTGDILAQSGDYAAFYAPFSSPAFTGVPTAPTAPLATNTNQIATTAFVLANAGSGSGVLLETNGVANSSQTVLNLAAGTNITLGNVAGTTTIAASFTAPVTSVFGRTGAVTAQSGDYGVAQVTGAAPLASPTFSGVPAAPTASLGTNTTQIATTAFVLANSGAMVFIAEQVLGSSAATVTFSSIPSTYRTLKLYVTARNNNASLPAGGSDIYLQFNGDTGANYSQLTVYSGGTAGGSSTYNTSMAPMAQVAYNGSPSNNADGNEITIPHYSNTTWNKTMLGQSARLDASTQGYVLNFSGTWLNTAAINQIVLGIVSGDSFLSGSIFTLYGIS